MKRNSTIIWRIAEISEILKTNVQAVKSNISGVSINTRTTKFGDLFFGIKGKKFNGSEFAKEALTKGAALAIVQKGFGGFDYAIEVDDVLTTLHEFASYARNRTTAKIIGITGSSGKTTVKEATYTILSALGQTHKNFGNENNIFGLTLNLSRMPNQSKFGVFEIGMNKPGEIGTLSKILNPEIAVITSIGDAHKEFFSTQQDIAMAKAEILTKNVRHAIIATDARYYEIFHKSMAKATDISTVGESEESDYQIKSYCITDGEMHIEIKYRNKSYFYSLNCLGLQFIHSTLLAAVVAIKSFDIKLEEALKIVSQFNAIEGRGNAIHLGRNIVLIDDSYNANPESMIYALQSLPHYKTKYSSSRLVVILGEMLELGAFSNSLHESLVPHINQNCDKLFAIGDKIVQNTYNKVDKEIQAGFAMYAGNILDDVLNSILPNDLVLVKGSNSVNTKHIVQKIIDYYGRQNGKQKKHLDRGNSET